MEEFAVQSDINFRAWGFGLLVVSLAGAAWFLFFAPEAVALRTCEAAIAAQLKAPTTYRRIDYRAFLKGDTPNMAITYEAKNSFGVPLRSEGWCTLSADLSEAVWRDRGETP